MRGNPRRIVVATVVATVLTGGVAARAGGVGSAPASGTFVPGEALIRFRPGTPSALVQAAHARAGATVASTLTEIGYQRVRFSASAPIDAVLASYRNDPNVAVAEPNHYARIAAASDDPCLAGGCAGVSGQWALAMTNTAAAWVRVPGAVPTAAQKRTLSRITVAVLDTKIDPTHPDFANAGSSSTDAASGGQLDLAGARDWIAPSQQSGAARYHGAYVAGLVSAATNNATGVAALGPRATILPLTVVDGTGRADAASLADAIVYAWRRGARVINLSLGLTADSQVVRDAIRAATLGSAPSLVVAAAGNNTGSAPFYPGSYPEVLAVAGTSTVDGGASCSNYNANVSVSAPAERVVSLDAAGGYVAPPCGTSAAAPQVSALAALLFAQAPARTPAEVRGILERSADDLGPAGRDDRFGHGRINADRALGTGPRTVLARATVPGAGGSTTITATAFAPAGVRAARVFIDSPDAAPVALGAADGAFGSANEALRSAITVSPALSAGPHPIYVQSFDGAAWGPSAVGVLLIDGRAPTIAGASATNGIRASGQPVVVSFTLGDDASPALAVGIQVFNATGAVVFQDSRAGVPQGPFSYRWGQSSSALPGTYQIKVIAADQSGKSSATMVGTVVA